MQNAVFAPMLIAAIGVFFQFLDIPGKTKEDATVSNMDSLNRGVNISAYL